jgi:hypothetical protein
VATIAGGGRITAWLVVLGTGCSEESDPCVTELAFDDGARASGGLAVDGRDDVVVGLSSLQGGPGNTLFKVHATGGEAWRVFANGGIGSVVAAVIANGAGEVAMARYDPMGVTKRNYVERYSPDGVRFASEGFSCCVEDLRSAGLAALDGASNVYHFTYLSTELDLGGGPRAVGAYVVRYDGANAYGWDVPVRGDVQTYHGGSGDALYALGTSPGGIGACDAAEGTWFVARVDGDGACGWVRTFAVEWTDPRLTISYDEEIYVSALAGGGTAIVTKLDAGGSQAWTASLPSAAAAVDGLEVSPAGVDTVVASLHFTGDLDLGQGVYSSDSAPQTALAKIVGGVVVGSRALRDGQMVFSGGHSSGDAVVATTQTALDARCGPHVSPVVGEYGTGIYRIAF